MRLRDLLWVILATFLWDFNFVVVQVGLEGIPPLFLCLARFLLASVPLIFFIKKPSIPFHWILLYGWLVFALQYIFLFLGMSLGMPAGLASLLYQTQVFFSLILGIFFCREKPSFYQAAGISIAFLGLGIIACHLEGSGATWPGFVLTLLAAAAWSGGNIITKKVGHINMLSLVVWGNLVAVPPLLLMTLLNGDLSLIARHWQHISWLSWSAVFYIAYLSTLGAFSVWNSVLSRYPLNTIAPFTVLVPLFGMISATLFLHEPLQIWNIAAGLLVLLGLLVSFLPKLSSHFQSKLKE